MPLSLAATSALIVPALDAGSKVLNYLSSTTAISQLDKAEKYLVQGLDILDSRDGRCIDPFTYEFLSRTLAEYVP